MSPPRSLLHYVYAVEKYDRLEEVLYRPTNYFCPVVVCLATTHIYTTKNIGIRLDARSRGEKRNTLNRHACPW